MTSMEPIMYSDIDHRRDFGVFVHYSPLNLQWLRQEPWGKHWPASLWMIDIYEYTAHSTRPMGVRLAHEFVLESGQWIAAGTQIQPDRHFFTDFGSIPPCFNGFPSLTRTRFLGPYLMHDSACRHGVLYFCPPGEKVFRSIRVTRLDSDRLLRIWVGCSPWNGNAGQRATIYSGVRIGSHF